MAIPDALGDQPGEHCSGRSSERVDPGEPGEFVGAEGGSCVEAEPAEPQQACSQHHQGEVVRTHRYLAEADSWPQHDRQCQCCRAGVDVDRGAARKVERLDGVSDEAATLGNRSVEGEDPVSSREIDQRGPGHHEDAPGAELHASVDRP